MPAIPPKEMSYRHEGVLNWLIMNPHRPLKDCAAELGYTLSWVSVLINSDMFQTQYRKRCEEMGVEAIHSIASKLSQVGALALDVTIQRLHAGAVSEKFLAEITRDTLDRLSFVPKQAKEPEQHLHIHVDGDVLRDARERARTTKDNVKPFALERSS